MRVLSWNVYDLPLTALNLPTFDVAVLTEVGVTSGWSHHVARADEIVINGRRRTKVAVLSHAPITSIRVPSGFHEGRILETRVDGVTVVGICVPWKGAYGETAWAAFTEFCRQLQTYVLSLEGPVIVAGDFNARPTLRPRSAHMRALGDAFETLPVVTRHLRKRNGRPLVDHIATNLMAGAMSLVGDNDENPSDHVGVTAVLSYR